MLAEATGFEVINRGINGNTTSEMLARFERDVLKHNPDYVVIMGGHNDIIWQESFDRIVWNLKAMIDMAQKKGIKVVLGLLIPVDDPYFEGLVARVREWMRDYALKNNVAYIDFASALRNEEGKVRTELLLDGAHPTREGYKKMFEAIPLHIFA